MWLIGAGRPAPTRLAGASGYRHCGAGGACSAVSHCQSDRSFKWSDRLRIEVERLTKRQRWLGDVPGLGSPMWPASGIHEKWMAQVDIAGIACRQRNWPIPQPWEKVRDDELGIRSCLADSTSHAAPPGTDEQRMALRCSIEDGPSNRAITQACQGVLRSGDTSGVGAVSLWV
jgi:hypothetical protein